MWLTMDSSISSPAILIEPETLISAREIRAISVVPPPMSTIMLAIGSVTGSPAPMAAAMGSSTRYVRLAPARSALFSTARFSTAVIPDGIAITTRGLKKLRRPWTLRMKYESIASVISKSVMTPSFSGRMAVIEPGVFPSISLATAPTALPSCST